MTATIEGPARTASTIAASHPGVRKGWADQLYREHLVDHATRLGIDLEVVRASRRPRLHGARAWMGRREHSAG